MHKLDKFIANTSRSIARHTSRRSFLSKLGVLLIGQYSLPLLPVARAAGSTSKTAGGQGETDVTSCDYWRYCGIDGYLCSCCGGSPSSCPPGTEGSPITWIGTCRNPADGKDYIISYNDCCGKGGCGRCFCNRNKDDSALYRPALDNDINWCLGTESAAYHCSLAVVLGEVIADSK